MQHIENARLSSGLKQRHVTMMSLGGVIGAGLFLGAGIAISNAGPAAIIAYALTGALVALVMRMLGEMAVAMPDSGSFSTYADQAIGHWAGFSIGWLYWWFWVLVIPIEATAAAAILNTWMPAVPTWVFALGITSLLTISNLLPVKNYGEFEFWLSMLKVIAIVAFLGLGAAAIMGWLPFSSVSGVSKLVSNGGFMPHGVGAIFSAMLATMFCFVGTEIITIAAAESDDPKAQIVKATNSVIWRILLFYLGSVFIISSLVAWDDPLIRSHGAYHRTLELIGLPNARLMIDVLILVAVASALNSALYTASRMVFSLASRGDAPRLLTRTDARGTPRLAVLASTAVGFLMVFANYFLPEYVFSFLLSTTGGIGLLVYLVIAVSQLRMRAKFRAKGVALPIRMWLYPWLTWAVIVFICGILLTMIWREEQRCEMLTTGALAVGVVAAALIHQWLRGRRVGQGARSAGAAARAA
ncbi:amino acid permease [Pandoraea sputorum]|uniref:GABA permease n=1 Tax=Pandoraea sputorum TaxID=93222 RepID=A0A5E5BG05_9BURK|nr:amino acid permease [Pandoraea sputorum]VVE85101.1 GABA permease [Pandoraea sputorum]